MNGLTHALVPKRRGGERVKHKAAPAVERQAFPGKSRWALRHAAPLRHRLQQSLSLALLMPRQSTERAACQKRSATSRRKESKPCRRSPTTTAALLPKPSMKQRIRRLQAPGWEMPQTSALL